MTNRSRAASVLRDALEQTRAGFEHARLGLLREPEQGPDLSLLGRTAAWLSSDRAGEALEEAAGSGEIDPVQRAWMERQLALVRSMPALLRADAWLRDALAGLRLPSDEAFAWPGQWARLLRVDDERARASASRELEHALRPIAQAYVVGRARADAPLAQLETGRPAPPAPAAAPLGQLIVLALDVAVTQPGAPQLPVEDWLPSAAEFLARTDAAAEDAVRYCLRAFKLSKPIPWHLVLRGLRAPELDSSSAAKQRGARVSAWLHMLGFASELQGRMRGEPDPAAGLPYPLCLPLAIPRDVRVAQSTLDFGVASDVLAAHGVGRALGLATCQGALPPELRWPVGASTAGVVGALGLQLWGDRLHLQRVQGLSAAAAERVGRLAGTLALLVMRLFCALAEAPRVDPDRAQESLEALAEPVGRALCCEVPPSIAGLIGSAQLTHRAQALESLAALAAHAALRERFDADWFRNPRAGELLRAACERGNLLGPEAFCTELGTALSAAGGRGIELVG